MRKEKERIFPQNTEQAQGHRGKKVKSVPRKQQGDQSAWNVKITETEQPREWLRGGQGLIHKDAAYWPVGSEHTKSEQRSGKWKTPKVFQQKFKALGMGL